jgi:hypothetical protein
LSLQTDILACQAKGSGRRTPQLAGRRCAFLKVPEGPHDGETQAHIYALAPRAFRQYYRSKVEGAVLAQVPLRVPPSFLDRGNAFCRAGVLALLFLDLDKGRTKSPQWEV